MKRPGAGIRLVTFDVGGTLIHPNPSVGAVYAEVLTRRGFPCEGVAVDRAFEESWSLAASSLPSSTERYGRSLEGERGYWRDLLADTVRRLGGLEPPTGAAEELFERFSHAGTWSLFPDVLPTLEALAGRAVPMAVISNWDSRLPGLLRDLGLRRYFGPLLVSALEACEKPDARIFHLAASRAGVRPAEVLHVGDRDREDVEGALRAGCSALKISRSPGSAQGLEAVLERLGQAATSTERTR